MLSSSYIGRFAPSPSGPLHFGSLVAALGSYLQARSQQGLWLVRMEDLDPPREVAGAADDILTTLEAFGLTWDNQILYQSQRHTAYQDHIQMLKDRDLAYHCQCSRKQIQMAGGYYPGTCRLLALDVENTAIRLRTDKAVCSFNDLLFGQVPIPRPLAEEDFIIKRKDGLYAYNLAVVIDDIYQGVTQVVRGADLIEPTGRQLYLYDLLDEQPPSYIHLPLAVTEPGLKLSKQNRSAAIDSKDPVPALVNALRFLGQPVCKELSYEPLDSVLSWAVKHWQLANVPRLQEIILK